MTTTGPSHPLPDSLAEQVEAFKQTDEYQAASVIDRERLLFATFPEVESFYKSESADHLESVAYPEGAMEGESI